MSRNAVGPMPDIKPRTWSRSRKGCCISIGLTPRSGSVASAVWMCSCMPASNNVATRHSMRARSASK